MGVSKTQPRGKVRGKDMLMKCPKSRTCVAREDSSSVKLSSERNQDAHYLSLLSQGFFRGVGEHSNQPRTFLYYVGPVQRNCGGQYVGLIKGWHKTIYIIKKGRRNLVPLLEINP